MRPFAVLAVRADSSHDECGSAKWSVCSASMPTSAGTPAMQQPPGASNAPPRVSNVQGGNMDNTTLLIILIVVIIVLGGGWYGRGRWY